MACYENPVTGPTSCRAALVMGGLAASTCSAPNEISSHDQSPEVTDLVDVAQWLPCDDAEDPWPLHRPGEIACDIAGWYPEDGNLEIDTGHCNYASLCQPAARTVTAGDTIEVQMWHFDLTAPEPSRAHLAITIGGHIILEREVPIPSAAASIEHAWLAPLDFPQTAPVTVHLHNHGQNTWTLAGLRHITSR